MDKSTLIERIKQTAYLEGEFTLRSGRKSRYYLDKYRFETQADILRALGIALGTFVGPRTTLIAGAELGGVALAAATALAKNLPFVIVRNQKKGYGKSDLVEGLLAENDQVLVVEDIATSGGQALEAARTIQQRGATVERIVAVIDRLEGARRHLEAAGFEFHALLTREDLGIAAD